MKIKIVTKAFFVTETPQGGFAVGEVFPDLWRPDNAPSHLLFTAILPPPGAGGGWRYRPSSSGWPRWSHPYILAYPPKKFI